MRHGPKVTVPVFATLLASILPAMTVAAAGTLAAPVTLAAQERPIIMIDPGHGGPDAGVVEGELIEKDLILQISYVVAAEFVREGYDVRFTRTGDYAVSWNDRRERAEEAGAALLIMLHINRNADPTRHGAEIYFSEESPASVRAASAFADELRADGTEVLLDPRGQAFLQSPSVPTVMLEVGFLTNPIERRLLLSESYHHELGRAFVRAAARLTR